MQLKVLYFAKIRELVGTAVETLELHDAAWTVGSLRAHLCARGGAWAESLAAGKGARAAVNQSMVGDDAAIPANAEVAFFPPVTGG
jgi:molybdopterin synthase sulfur carrier subunit